MIFRCEEGFNLVDVVDPKVALVCDFVGYDVSFHDLYSIMDLVEDYPLGKIQNTRNADSVCVRGRRNRIRGASWCSR